MARLANLADRWPSLRTGSAISTAGIAGRHRHQSARDLSIRSAYTEYGQPRAEFPDVLGEAFGFALDEEDGCAVEEAGRRGRSP